MTGKQSRAKKIRERGEFDAVHLSRELRPPRVSSSAYAWSIEDIRAARDAQMAGRFRRPARLAESMRTDDALFTAWTTRLAPQKALPIRLQAADETDLAMQIRDEAAALFGPLGVGVTPDVLAGINSTLANHGVAFGCNTHTPRLDGSRVDVEMREWPIEEVEWHATDRAFVTRVEGGVRARMDHGDGRWVVFQSLAVDPWKSGAVLPGGLVWGSRALASRDWSKGSASHGNAKVIGSLPEGVPLTSADGTLTAETEAFLALLRDVASADSPVGIKPAGSDLEYLTNSSQAWQVWERLMAARDRAASMIYNGQDIGKATGGSQRLSLSQLYGVRDDIVEGDLHTIERGLLTGVIEIWAAMNFGDSALAPRRLYLIPDVDEDTRKSAEEARLAARVDRTKAFFDVIEAAKSAGFSMTQEYVDATATSFDVDAPTWPAAPATPPAPIAPPPDAFHVVPLADDSEQLTDDAVAVLAAKMTELGVERCEHGSRNRCRLCGLERVRDFEIGEDGAPSWKIAWKPIGAVVPAQ